MAGCETGDSPVKGWGIDSKEHDKRSTSGYRRLDTGGAIASCTSPLKLPNGWMDRWQLDETEDGRGIYRAHLSRSGHDPFINPQLHN